MRLHSIVSAIVASVCGASATAQLADDARTCIREQAPPAMSCMEVSVLNSPKLQPACMAELAEAMAALDRWEECVSQAMEARHADERRRLRERAADRRRSYLQALQLGARTR